MSSSDVSDGGGAYSHLLGLFYSTHRHGSSSIGWGPAYFGGSNRVSARLATEAILLYLVAAASYLGFAFLVLTSRGGRRANTFVVGSFVIATAYTIAIGVIRCQRLSKEFYSYMYLVAKCQSIQASPIPTGTCLPLAWRHPSSRCAPSRPTTLPPSRSGSV